MASNYPGSLDSFDTIASDKKTSDAVGGRTHRQMHNDLGDAIEAIEAELGTDPSGGSATVKARLDAIGTVGTGSPEGVVTAAPGSTWLQTDATTDVKGWIRWVKATGTGNTGWKAGPEADTGWRNLASWTSGGVVTGTIPTGFVPRTGVAGYIAIRRVGSTVNFEVVALQLNASNPTLDSANVAGFRCRSEHDLVLRTYNGSSWALTYAGTAGTSTWTVTGSAGHFMFRNEWSWSTANDWPAVLPGSAA